MSNLIADPNSNLNISPKSNAPIKLLVFEVGKLTLALPILQVQKIVKQNEVHGSGLSHVNLSHLAEEEIAIVDLHQKLFGVSLTNQGTTGYFIITKDIAGEPLGIVLQQPPTLVDVTVDRIRLIPNSYRRADTLEIASHVTVIPQAETTRTVFILDLTRLI